jgi:predicted dehydrogenase
MVGGGPGAFIGEVHRKAAALDGMIDLVAGAFDIDPKKSRQMGRELCLDKKRVYNTYEDMIAGELALPEDERIDFVSITTPNNWHFPIAKAFWEAGFHIVCEKPMTMDIAEAKKLKAMVNRKRKQVFALMHNYTGYPMVKLARDMVAAGDIGDVRKIKVQYPQGWLADAVEKTGQQQASWRTDPKQAGAAGCMGDIGTHAENLAEYITGLQMLEVCADLTTFVKGRKLDDDGNVLVHWQKGVKGVLTASQIAIGEENGLAIWIYGEKGGLEWHQEHPNYLYVKRPDSPVEIWRRGNDYIGAKSPAAARATRLPFGHPEAFFEAFANVYRNFAETILTLEENKKVDDIVKDFPTVNDGLRGMQFIDAVVKSSAKGAKWVKFPK